MASEKNISNKVSKNIGIMTKIRNNVHQDVLLTLYNSLILPYFNYCNVIWSTSRSIQLEALIIKQKKAVRLICRAKWNAHTKPLFVSLGLLNIYDINKLQVCCFMYKVKHRMLPQLFLDWFTYNCNIHNYDTRHCSDFYQKSYSTVLRAHTTVIYGVKLWNSLHKEIAEAPSLYTFKRRYKHLLINNSIFN